MIFNIVVGFVIMHTSELILMLFKSTDFIHEAAWQKFFIHLMTTEGDSHREKDSHRDTAGVLTCSVPLPEYKCSPDYKHTDMHFS